MINSSTDDYSVRLSVRVYQLLLVAYPAKFRQEYSSQMLQVFRDCSLRAHRQGGISGLISLWELTLFDWFKTVIEEQINRGTEMTRIKFIRLSGWALMLAPITLVAGFGIGGGETYYDDPLGGIDGFYEYSQLILIPLSLFLFTVGMLGLRSRYGEFSGWLGKIGLVIATIGGALAFISAIPLFALMAPWIVPWWSLMVYAILVMVSGLSLFGFDALRTKPLQRWNALPMLTAIWFPLVFVIVEIMKLRGRNADSIDDYLAFVALLFMFFGSLVLGYILQKDTSTELSEPSSQT